jgi:hypothetical protein
MLIKTYSSKYIRLGRCSSPECTGTLKKRIQGDPDMEHVSASFVERKNLTMRMQLCRFTRLTNTFNKKVENHNHSLAIHYRHYNFARLHQTLRSTPALRRGYGA